MNNGADVILWLCISYTGRFSTAIQGKAGNSHHIPNRNICSVPSTHSSFNQVILMPQAAPYPAMSHLSSILERDAAVTDPARSKCSFSNSVPFKKKKWKSNSAGSEGFNFNHLPFALSRDCSQRKSCFEASLLHGSESINLCSEIHNTKRIHYPPAFKDTPPYPTYTHWSSLLHTKDSVHHLPSISSHQVIPSSSWLVPDPMWLSTAPQSRDKSHPQAQGTGHCLKQVIYHSQLHRKKKIECRNSLYWWRYKIMQKICFKLPTR